jgi:hypothetical protein
MTKNQRRTASRQARYNISKDTGGILMIRRSVTAVQIRDVKRGRQEWNNICNRGKHE